MSLCWKFKVSGGRVSQRGRVCLCQIEAAAARKWQMKGLFWVIPVCFMLPCQTITRWAGATRLLDFVNKPAEPFTAAVITARPQSQS